MINKEKIIIAKTTDSNKIDYDKLADALVKAERKAATERSYITDTFSFITGTFFRVFACIGRLLGIVLLCGLVYSAICSMVWVETIVVLRNVAVILLMVMLVIFIFLFSLMLSKSAKEIEREKDKQFVISVFSGISSFAAVIIALVALIN